jgi:hypothetical protein
MGFDRSQFVTVTGASLSSASAVFSSAVSTGSLLAVLQAYFNGGALTFSTVTDNVNNAGFVLGLLSTNAASTAEHVIHHYKLNLSSGRAASTYRVSINYSGAVDLSFCALEYTGGGTISFGSTGSSAGNSTGPRGPQLTAGATPFLQLGGATVSAAPSGCNSTVVGTGAFVTTVNVANSMGQTLNVIQSTGSSLAQQLTHSISVASNWVAGTVLYTGTVTGGAATGSPWTMCMMGVQ